LRLRLIAKYWLANQSKLEMIKLNFYQDLAEMRQGVYDGCFGCITRFCKYCHGAAKRSIDQFSTKSDMMWSEIDQANKSAPSTDSKSVQVNSN